MAEFVDIQSLGSHLCGPGFECRSWHHVGCTVRVSSTNIILAVIKTVNPQFLPLSNPLLYYYSFHVHVAVFTDFPPCTAEASSRFIIFLSIVFS